MLYKATDSIGKAVFKNCYYIADKLGAEIKRENDEFFVVYKDDAAIAVGIQRPELEESLTEYQKIDNRGDVVRKAEVLCTLAKKLEPLEKCIFALNLRLFVMILRFYSIKWQGMNLRNLIRLIRSFLT